MRTARLSRLRVFVRLVAVVCSLPLLVACSQPASPSVPATPSEELARNQAKFQSTVGANYQVTYQNHCFCAVLEPVRLTVRSGVVTAVARLSDGQPIPSSQWPAYRTVNAVFGEIAKGLTSGARRVDATYDSRYGYPLEVLIDYQMAADNFIGFKLSDLVIIR